MGQLKDLHKQLRDAVEKGTDSVESLHRQVANWPLDELEKMEQLREPVANVRKFQDMLLGGVYGMVRGVNDRVSEAAEMLVNQIEPDAPSGGGTGGGGAPKGPGAGS